MGQRAGNKRSRGSEIGGRWWGWLSAPPDELPILLSVGSLVPLGLAALMQEVGHGLVALFLGVLGVIALVVGMWLGGESWTRPITTRATSRTRSSTAGFERVEPLGAAKPVPPAGEGDQFEQLVRDALDELPDLHQRALKDNVAVVISDEAGNDGYCGLYRGGTAVHGRHHSNAIVIYRHTLMRDFCHDPSELRRQVAATVCHLLAHRLDANERRVTELGP